jgi:hypothetical protein
MNYPLHLGVTEAGDGEDARIKSALGIGALLEDGLGDTLPHRFNSHVLSAQAPQHPPPSSMWFLVFIFLARSCTPIQPAQRRVSAMIGMRYVQNSLIGACFKVKKTIRQNP